MIKKWARELRIVAADKTDQSNTVYTDIGAVITDGDKRNFVFDNMLTAQTLSDLMEKGKQRKVFFNVYTPRKSAGEQSAPSESYSLSDPE